MSADSEHEGNRPTTRLVLQVDADLHRAFQRCSWIIINETARDQIDVMNEMLRDFLVKYGC